MAVYTLGMIRASLLLLALGVAYAQSALPNREKVVREAARGIMKHLARNRSLAPGRVIHVAPPMRDTTVCASPLTPLVTGRPGQFAQKIMPLGQAIPMPAVVAPAPPCPVI
ncbi:MAG TPA: hypothetical protein VFQ91_12585 [Bryobacteraceae bacterium]|nr:hypothetical protein [Bryobacteraceae bacterium]